MKYVSSIDFKIAKNRTGLGIRKDYVGNSEDIGDRTLKFTLSTSTPDRSNDVVNQSGWDISHYLRNPVVLWNHTSEQLPVGRCIDIGIEDNCLKATVEFVPSSVPVAGQFADAVLQLCRAGFLSATSVGFLPIEVSETDDQARGAGTYSAGLDFHSSQLIEFSIVCTPDNPEALIEPGQQVGITPPLEAPEKSSSINNSKRKRRERLLNLNGRKFRLT